MIACGVPRQPLLRRGYRSVCALLSIGLAAVVMASAAPNAVGYVSASTRTALRSTPPQVLIGIVESEPRSELNIDEVSASGRLVRTLVAGQDNGTAAISADGTDLYYAAAAIYKKDLTTGVVTQLTQDVFTVYDRGLYNFGLFDVPLVISGDNQYLYFVHGHPPCSGCTDPPKPGPELWGVPTSVNLRVNPFTPVLPQNTKEQDIGPDGGALGHYLLDGKMVASDGSADVLFLSLNNGRVAHRLPVSFESQPLDVIGVAPVLNGAGFVVLGDLGGGDAPSELYLVNAATRKVKQFNAALKNMAWTSYMTSDADGYVYVAQAGGTPYEYVTYKCKLASLSCAPFIRDAYPVFVVTSEH